MIEFEWDPSKAEENVRKHCVDFRDAATIFRDPLGITIFDPHHSQDEDRYITVGRSPSGRLLIVGHTDRGERIRIISARELTSAERKAYENEIKRRKA